MMLFSFLVAMIWKSVLIAGSALALAFAVRWRSASDRLILLRTGVAMLLALPLIMGFLPALQIVAFAAPEAPVVSYPMPIVMEVPASGPVRLPVAAPPPAVIDPGTAAMLIYVAGLAVLAAWQLAGLAVLRLWTRGAQRVTSPHWLGVLAGLDLGLPAGRRIELLVSRHVKSPLSWGCLEPVILLDEATLDHPEDAEAILVHEVAHIVRRDWPALMLARLAVILFWFNPLVWLLEREMVQQSEQAADLEAANRVGAAHYAEKLLGWARFGTRLPVNSIAASSSALGRRVRNILDGPVGNHSARGAWASAATLLCIGVATPIAAMQLVAANPAPPAAPAKTPAAIETATLAPSSVPAASSATPAPVPAPATAGEDARRGSDPDGTYPEGTAVIGQDVENAIADAERASEEAIKGIDRAEIAKAARAAQRAQRWPSYPDAGFNWASPQGQQWEQFGKQWEQFGQTMGHQSIARSIESGAAGMEMGASQMEAQADNLERMGRQFQTDRAYRERAIERSHRWGKAVTHEELIEAGKGMQEGARGMRDGAREMREAATRMRHVRSD